MAEALFMLLNRRDLLRERIFWDRNNHLDYLDDTEIMSV